MSDVRTPKPKCSAHKKDGAPCGRWPIRGATVCPKHGGAAPQVKKRAIERIIAASDLAAAQLISFMNDKKVPYNVRLAATRDLLDRAIGPAAQTIRLGIGDPDPWGELLAEIMDDDVLVPVDRRAITARPASRGDGVDDDDEPEDDDGPDVQVVDPGAHDDDASFDHLSFDTPGTIRSEVVAGSRNAEPPVPQRLRKGLGLPPDSGERWTR